MITLPGYNISFKFDIVSLLNTRIKSLSYDVNDTLSLLCIFEMVNKLSKEYNFNIIDLYIEDDIFNNSFLYLKFEQNNQLVFVSVPI